MEPTSQMRVRTPSDIWGFIMEIVQRATRLVRCETELRYLRSGGDALIVVVEAGNLWNGDDLARSRTL
jgi:hypothetical protein